MKKLQILFLLFLTICLSGCYQRFYCELKTDHLLVSAVDGRSYSKLSIEIKDANSFGTFINFVCFMTSHYYDSDLLELMAVEK